MKFNASTIGSDYSRIGGRLGGFFAIAGGSLWLAGNSFYNVDAGHRAIVFNRFTGVKSKIYGEGTHLRLPWVERAIIYDVRTKPRVLVSLTGSKDLQMVNITCRVLARPDETKLPIIYRNLGKDHDEKVLPSIINEVLKSVVAQYNASQLLTQRETVSRAVREQLFTRAREFNILLDDVSLTHLSFSSEYERAVESKQVAQQQAERAKYIVLKAKEEKKSIILKAQGESTAAKLIGEAVKTNPGFIALRRIEAAKEIANTISKSSNKVLLDSENLLLSFK